MLTDFLVTPAHRSILLFLCILLVLVQACSKKPRVPASPSPSTTADQTSGGVAGIPEAPALDLRIEPQSIGVGDSAVLSWETQHADQVVIEPAIGAVEPSGRIKFYPDETTTYSVTAQGAGGVLSKSVTVTVTSDRGAAAPGMLQEDLSDMSLPERFNLHVKPVFFDFDSAELTDEARLTLDGNIQWLQRIENRGIRFVLEGHTDERGSEEYNLALGDRRAQVVKNYLVSGGIEASRIEAISLGEESPVEKGSTEGAYALNRRAQFVILR